MGMAQRFEMEMGMKKDRAVSAYSADTIEDVSSFIKKIRKYIGTGEKKVVVYRGEPELYPTPCRPNIFRGDMLDKSRYYEKSLFDSMRQNGLTSDKNYLINAIDAQHGEFPSRLLDVTYNCLVALYFAVTPYYHRNETDLDEKDGMVFVVEVQDIYSPSAQNTNEVYDAIISREPKWFADEIVFGKNHKFIDHIKLNHRIIAQQGAFILFQGNDAADLPAYMLHGIRIPHEAKKALRSELKLLFGIHTGTIYPEIVNLVKDLSEKSTRLNTDAFSCESELNQVIENFKRETDYYLEYFISCSQDASAREKADARLIVEKMINSYRVGLLTLHNHLKMEQADEGEQEACRSAIERYNLELEQFSRRLQENNLGEISKEKLRL